MIDSQWMNEYFLVRLFIIIKTNLKMKKKQNVDPTSDSKRREERGG